MGGDGGVIASNRKYMRGAGTADHTGDSASSSRDAKDPAVEREEMHRSMKTCAVSNKPLHFVQQESSDGAAGGGTTIVACPYGRLYNKEAAVEALLRRKRADKQQDGKEDELGSHIRGLKDLYEVRFHFVKQEGGELIPTCPIRGSELNGQIPAVVLVPGGSEGQVNVVSERAIQEMGEQAIMEDYGPIHEKIRLAPSAAALVEIKKALSEKRASEEKTNKKHKKDKKRKRENQPSKSSKEAKAKDDVRVGYTSSH
jgi:Rtf2 RING-finger